MGLIKKESCQLWADACQVLMGAHTSPSFADQYRVKICHQLQLIVTYIHLLDINRAQEAIQTVYITRLYILIYMLVMDI